MYTEYAGGDPGLTQKVSRFIVETRFEEIPEEVRRLAKRSILDGLGLAVSGSRSRGARISRKVIDRYRAANAEASLLGTSERLPARFAAFANGLAIHADDYDDTQLAVASDRVYGLLTHPTAPVLPGALALAERDDRSGSDLLLSYLIGVEVATKIAEAINPSHYDNGFHSTATMGAIGAGAAVARALHLDQEKTSIALGIAASQAAGLRENFGTMTKPFHAGRAAESGVFAGELAQLGFTAAEDILEARRGFFQAAGGGYAPGGIDNRLGNPWTFEEPGISIKPYPSGSLTHPGMGAFAELVLKNDLRPNQVKRIVVGTNRHMPNALIHHRPVNELQAKFSMEFCIAILLIERNARLAQFTDEVVNREDVRAMIERIDFGVDPEAEAAGYNTMTTIIRVERVDGSRLETRAAFGKGSPQNPMSDQELIEKFTDCLEWGGLQAADAGAIADRVLKLEQEASVRDLASLLRLSN